MHAMLFAAKCLLAVPLLLWLSSLAFAEIRYVYDDLDRLVGVIDHAGASAQYTYDAVGNITAIVRRTASQASVMAVVPSSGPVGTPIRIYGTGFSATPSLNTVAFSVGKGKKPTSPVTAATPNELLTTVPVNAATGPITVTCPSGTATTSTFTVTKVTGSPTITGFSPSVATSGSALTVTGTNFDPTAANDKVKVNRSAARVNTASATSLGVTVPLSTGSGRVTATTLTGSAVSAADLFVPPSPYTATDVQVTGRIGLGGSGKAVNLTTANKLGLVIFDGTAGQRVGLSFSNVTLTSTIVTLHDPFTAPLTAIAVGPSGGGLGIALPMDGTYTVRVGPSGATYTGSLTVRVSELTDLTGTIAIGGPAVPMTIALPGQRLRLTFEGIAGQRLGLGFTAVTVAYSTISVLAPDGATLTSAGVYSGSGGSLDLPTLPATGTYTILVEPGGSYAGNMTFTLSEELSGTISVNGAALPLSLARPGQNARVTFPGTAGQRVSIALTGVTIPSGTISLVKPDGATFSSTSLSTSGKDLDSEPLPSTGSYAILVDPQGTNTGNVTLTLSTDITTPLPLNGAPLTVTLRPGQNVRAPFAGTAGQRVSLALTAVGLTTYCCSGVTGAIVSPDGTTLGSVNVGSSGGDLDSPPLPSNGTYEALINAGTSTGNVTLTLSSDIAGAIAIDGAPIASTLRPGQNARLTFSGTAGQRVSVGLTGVTLTTSCCYNVFGSILNPDGTTLGSVQVGTNGGEIDAPPLPVTGAYTVLVNAGVGSGNVTLTLSGDYTAPILVDGPPVTTALRPGQNARLAFNGTVGQRVSLGLTGVSLTTSCCYNVFASLLNPDGTTLGSVQVGTNGGDIDSPPLPVTGTYTVLITAGAGAGNITLTLSSDFAGPIALDGESLTTSLRPGQNVRIPFSGTTGQRVSLALTGVRLTTSCCYNVFGSILNPDGTTLASVQVGTNGGDIDSPPLPSAGNYTILVNAGAGSGAITLTLSSDYSSPISADGAPVTAALRPGQNARLAFAGTAGQRVSLALTGVTLTTSCCYNVFGSILNPDGTTLASVQVGSNGGDIDSGTLPSTGTYGILVNAGAGTGNVTLTLSSDFTGPIVIDGPPATASLRAGQNARFSFSGTAGQRVSAALTGVTLTTSCCYNVFGSILNPDGTTLSSVQVGTNGGDMDTGPLPATGPYSILVDAGAGTGSVTVTLSSDAAPPLALDGPPATVTLRPGQNVRIPFNGTAGQRLSLGLSGITLTTYCCGGVTGSILNPDGTTLSSVTVGAPGGDIDTAPLPTTGTYSILLNAGALTGNITLTLSSDVTGPLPLDGAPLTVNLRSGQNIRVPFSGTAGQRVSVGLSGIGLTTYCCGGVYGYLLNPDGTPLASVQVGAPGGDIDSPPLPTSGTYSILVTAGALTGSITLTFSSDITGPLPLDGPPLVTSLRPGQNIRVPFAGTAGQRVSVGLSSIGLTTYCCGGVYGYLLNPDGTTLASVQVGAPGGDIDSPALPSSGTHSVVVNAGALSGNIAVTFSGEVTGPILIGGSPVTVTLRPGQNARLSFDGSLGQRVRLTLSGVTLTTYCCGGVYAHVLAPDGATLASRQVGAPGGQVDTSGFPTTGTYTVLVNAGALTGNVTLTLTLLP